MSTVPKEAIEVIAQSIGVTNLTADVLPALASDVEYRVREIMQEAIKCMRHSKRTILTSDDVESALMLRNVEPIYGFASGDPLRFKRAGGHKDLFYVEEKDVEFKDVLDASMPKTPLDTAIVTHWLAIEGIQPAIPENAPSEVPSDHKKSDYREDGIPVDIKLPVKHVLSKELQLYFEKITDLTVGKSGSIIFKEALMSLATDSGLHPLIPYFMYFIADEVTRNLNDFPRLFALMRLAWSLLQNPQLHIETYLHQLMPSVLTCLIAKKLGNKYSDNHWELRNFTANLIAQICRRFGHIYHNLQARVMRTLLHAFLDPGKALPQHYGAIQGLSALGTSVVSLLVLPNLEAYLLLLEPEMQLEKQKNEMKGQEAWRVYGALLSAAGLCLYDRIKMLPSVLFPPPCIILKSKAKLKTVMPNKRKACTDNMMQQPPLKKMATEGSMGSDAGLPSKPRQLTNESTSGVGGVWREKVAGALPSKMLPTLSQAWKEDMEAGHLQLLLFEHFGESIFSFVPMPELSFFL